ncbi:MAG TPA: radical SAM protein [Blastocatellia bacterium]
MEKVIVPPRMRNWTKGEWHIYFDPYNFVWVRVNDSGKLLIELFRKHLSIDEAAEHVAAKFPIARDQAGRSIRQFVDGLVASRFLHIGDYWERPRGEFPRLDFPHDIYLHLTNKCNLKCPYCYNKDDRENKIKLERKGGIEPTLSTEEFKNLIASCIRNGVHRLLFTGGEPLLRADVMELVAFARSLSQDVYLEMLTNAIKIDDSIAALMCQYLNAVTISLDGHEAHLHERYRGKGTFDPTVKGVRTLVAKKAELGQDRPYVAIVPALTDKNIINTKDIYQFSLEDLGANGLAPIVFQAGDHQELNISQIPDLGVYVEVMDRTNEYLAERRERLGLQSANSTGVAARNHCGVGHGEISVDPSGTVYPCQSLHFDEFRCGNVRDADIKEIFADSTVMKRVRGTTVDKIAVCSHCDLKYLCNAGCRATAYNVYRQFDAHNEIYCKFLETMAVEKMWGTSHVSMSA